LDRVDLVIEVPAVSAADLITPGSSEPSAAVARRVNRARKFQTQRYQELGLSEITSNAVCPVGRITEIAALDDAGLSLLRSAADAMKLTARGYHRVLKVARTIADLDGQETLHRIHLAEALSYRSRDMIAR
jgi:magnesium chelatase family protein